MIYTFLKQPFQFMIIYFCVVEMLNKAISGDTYGANLSQILNDLILVTQTCVIITRTHGKYSQYNDKSVDKFTLMLLPGYNNFPDY